MDNPRNADGIGSKELLVVSFGTSYPESRALTVGAIEAAMEAAFPDYSVRRAFTSQMILNVVKKRDGISIDNVTEALDRAAANRVEELIVQPTHLMDGIENHILADKLSARAGEFRHVALGAPLLSSEDDFYAVMEAVLADTAAYDDGETAICLMGHGSEAAANSVYHHLQALLLAEGHTNCFVGTVEAVPTLDELVAKVKQGSFRRVLLTPLMIVAGDHANNDMAGDDEDSWKSVFEAEGYEVICQLRGLGQLPAIQNILTAHARAAMEAERI